MAYKYREEIVGKRFLSVSGFTKLKLGKINEWGWRSGVIRAASHKDNKHKDLQVLVEYDDVEWHRREWISIYKDSLFHFFLVEQALVWSDRKDPFSSHHHSGNILWPALTFAALVSTVDISAQSQPVEFLLDRELAFKDYARLEPFLEWDTQMAGVRDYPELRAEVRRWAELQDGQRILLTTPSVLVGYRVEVYRAEGTTQWYTAVIVGYNEATRDLTVTDDTVLEEHNEDPSLVQMRLIGDGVVESIMRGENVGITPRRSRSALLQTHQQQPSRVGRGGSGISGLGTGTGASRNHNSGVAQAAAHRKQRQSRPSSHLNPETHADHDDKGTVGKNHRKRKSSENDVIKPPRKEDVENKQSRKSTRNSCNRGAKKKVLEEANNSKLRQHVQVRVEDCLQNGQRLSALCRRPPVESDEAVQVDRADKVVSQISLTTPIEEDCTGESSNASNSSISRDSNTSVEQETVLQVPQTETEHETAPEPSPKQEPEPSPKPEPEPQAAPEPEIDPEPELIEGERETVTCALTGDSIETSENKNKEDVNIIDITSNEPDKLQVDTEQAEPVSEEDDCVIVSEEKHVPPEIPVPEPEEEDTTRGESEAVCSSRDDDDGPLSSSSPFGRMELSDSSGTTLLRFPDDRSDSGVSSLRSGSCASGDERSGSRSSALSSSDEPQQQQQQHDNSNASRQQHINSNSSNNRSPLYIPASTQASSQPSSQQHHQVHSHPHQQQPGSLHSSSSAESAPVRVWRDPNLLLESEPHVRHIHSVQHQSLLMSHPAVPASSAPTPSVATSAAAAAAAALHYPGVVAPPPPLLGHHLPHPLQSHLPPPLYSQMPPEMLWKHQRYAPLPVGHHLLGPQTAPPAPEELLERERAYAQDRDRHERLLRERREQEVREMEKQQHKEREKERERIERERIERQEREKAEREREREKQAERERQDRLERDQERERQEKQRAAEQAVHKHFEESLRLAHQKRERTACWNLISLPPPTRGSSSNSVEEDRKRAEQELRQAEQHRQLQATERLARERAYYAMNQTQRPPSVPSKQDYPPPPAHSRVSSNNKPADKMSVGHTTLPKAEPNFNLFNYPYQPTGFVSHDPKVKLDHHKQAPQSNTSLVVNKNSSAMALDRERDLVLPNPPPLMSEIKNSVIVKHEVKSPHHLEPKVSVAHSPSPKLRGAADMSHYIQTSASQSHKSSMYEYRSPTQSPHHLQQHPHTPSPHHHMEPQNLGKAHQQGHHRSSNQLPSPHALHQRQSPHQHAHAQQQHPSNADNRYSRADTPSMMYPAAVKSTVAGSYGYMPPSTGGSTASHYPMVVGASASSKPKVSSPAPPHMYGKPTAGIVTGIPVSRVQEVTPPSNPIPLTSKPPLSSSVSPSPYQQVSQYHPPHPHPQAMTACRPPPPAHSQLPSSRTSSIESRPMFDHLYPPGNVPGGLSAKPLLQHHGTSPPTATAAPSPISRSPHLPHSMPPMSLSVHHSPVNAGAVQTQPLDLGVSSDRNAQRDDGMSSPKRKGTPLNQMPGGPIALDVKKRRIDSPGAQPIHPSASPQTINLHSSSSQPQLARVSEPSPLIASAATTITTVVNTAAYRTPATIIMSQNHPMAPEIPPDVSVTAVPAPTTVLGVDMPARCGSNPLVTSNTPPAVPVPGTTSNSPVASPAAVVTSAPSTVTEAPSTPVKIALTPSVVDSEKSNSPGPVKTSSSTNYPVRHLKKAWLQRHTGEDVEDTTGVTGTGTCVTLPIPIVNNSANAPAKETPAVNSLHTIGSMAINSINKTKSFTPKGNSRKGNASKDVGTVNGHGTDASKNDDSSSSDERGRKSPPKRKPPKVKRKKGGGGGKKTTTDDLKKRKVTATQSVAASESGSDSDKESGSEKDSDSGASTNQPTGKKAANGGNTTAGAASGKDKEPRKRGRRPKSSKNDKGEEPRNKKSRDEPSLPQRDPFRKPPVGQLKKTGESFLQDGPCFEVAPKLAKCRECRWTPNQRSKNMPNIFCRFYAFRRLRYTKNGQLAIAGFSDPHKDALEEDLKLWLPSADTPPQDLDLEMSRLLLMQVGDHFCDLLVQEKDALAEHMSEDKTIAWKRVVQGVREMCDVCETTLFNFHWACGKCGFVVCLDCYKGRKIGSVKIWGESRKDRDDCSWLLCTNRQAHEQEKLMLTQIIAGDSLIKLGRKVHEYRDLWGIPQYCGCSLSKETKCVNGSYKEIIKSLLKGEMNGIKTEKKDEDSDKALVNGASIKEEKKSPLSWLADVALSNEDKKTNEDSSDSDCEKEGNFSTLRELLIRPSHKSNGSRATSPSNTTANNNGLTKPVKKSRMDTLDEVISSVIEDTVQKGDDMIDVKPMELKHFVRRYNWQSKGREALPIRIMTLTESKILYPDTPHSWLCDGKLLRLLDPIHTGNYRLFQDQWKRGQPVIVSDVTRTLDNELWHPDSFIRDFGDDKNDLINCMTGNLVPNQPMRKFWEGFEHFSKRLKDERGNPMLLKLKDWPPGEDFAELMPSRFSDLMRVLPLSEYTHRSGRLNLASRLPECFVRPDLGPKMYNAYGSALYPTKGTTNLHLDISDAVNVMVYVGIPKDGDNDEHIKEAFRAIDEAGCDILTRRRVRDKGELPGALWHIYNARDADKIRDLLNKVALEKGARLEPHHDPIHDQSCYLDGPLRERLYKEYGVEGYAIVQCLGDAVFIPAGAPHQVRNLHNCIKVAEDFVSPENVSHCFHLTQEFRELSDTHTNHEDKLQIKNIIYHAVKDSLSVLSGLLNSQVKVEESSGTTEGQTNTGAPAGTHASSNSSDSNSPSASPTSHDTDSTKEQV